MEIPSKPRTRTTILLNNPVLGTYAEKTIIERDPCTPVSIAVLHFYYDQWIALLKQTLTVQCNKGTFMVLSFVLVLDQTRTNILQNFKKEIRTDMMKSIHKCHSLMRFINIWILTEHLFDVTFTSGLWE